VLLTDPLSLGTIAALLAAGIAVVWVALRATSPLLARVVADA